MWSREFFKTMIVPEVIGMVHLQPLPGSPHWAGDLPAVTKAALTDARNLVQGGVGAVMVENFHDVPFFPDHVPAITVAAMTQVIGTITREYPDLPLGVNVLRNDAEAALAVAVATGAAFIRVNVHVGAAVTDQGTIEGQAWRTLRQRREWGGRIGILADVRVKHARPLVVRPLAEEAKDLRLRGLADGIIITGVATGQGASPAEVSALREALPDCPLLIGSGVTVANANSFLPAADGIIVGTSLKVDPGRVGSPVATAKARELVDVWQRNSGTLEDEI